MCNNVITSELFNIIYIIIWMISWYGYIIQQQAMIKQASWLGKYIWERMKTTKHYYYIVLMYVYSTSIYVYTAFYLLAAAAACPNKSQ